MGTPVVVSSDFVCGCGLDENRHGYLCCGAHNAVKNSKHMVMVVNTIYIFTIMEGERDDDYCFNEFKYIFMLIRHQIPFLNSSSERMNVFPTPTFGLVVTLCFRSAASAKSSLFQMRIDGSFS